MNQKMYSPKYTSIQVVFAVILSIVVLVVSQILSLAISELPLNIGVPPAICNIFAGILFVAFALMGAKLLCQKLLKASLNELRIPRLKMNPL